MVQEIRKSPCLSLAKLKSIYLTGYGKSVSKASICRFMLKNSVKSYVAAKKPFLTRSMAKKRWHGAKSIC